MNKGDRENPKEKKNASETVIYSTWKQKMENFVYLKFISFKN